MILSLSIVIIAAVLGSVALFFLLGSNVADQKKQKILVIMGSLLLLAILISNFKSNEMFTFSLLNSSTKSKINSIFSNTLPPYQQKYNFHPKIIGDYLLEKNYALDSYEKDYNEYIIYLSNNEEGASYFLYQLASKLRDQGYPTFYLKMESPSGSSKQFFRKTGLYSYDAFKSAVNYYLQQKTKPFIIVDNAELLPLAIWQILVNYDQVNSPHLIFNTQNGPILFQKISEVSHGRQNKDSTNFLTRFQVQKFNGADQSTLEKLSPENSFIKRGIINFKNIFNMKNGATQQEVHLKTSNANSNVANYFGVSNHYTQIKRLLERGPVQFSSVRQAGIPYQVIQQMQKLRLIRVRNGEVILE